MDSAQPAASPAASPLEAAVGDTLDQLRGWRFHLWVPVLMGVIMLFDSWDSIAIAYAIPSIAKDWGLNPAVMGVLISSGYAGQFVGAIVLGALAERLGRKPVFAAAVLVMGLFALATAFTHGPATLFGLRFVQGLAIGGALPVSVTWINELAPTQTRGRYFALFQWLSMSGYAVASLASSVIIPALGWRWLLGLGALPLALLPLVLLTLPESPRWLARSGRGARVPAALAALGAAPGALPPPDPAAPAPRIPVSRLFAPDQRRTTLTLLAIWFTVAFTNFGLTTWAPSIFVKIYHQPQAIALRTAAMASLLFLAALPLVGLTMDRTGRRAVGITVTAIAGLAMLAPVLVDFGSFANLRIVLLTGMVAISLGTFIAWPYSAECYPTHLRAVGVGLCSSMARGASMLTPLFVGVILARGASISVVYAVFALFAFTTTALWIFATTETARRRLG